MFAAPRPCRLIHSLVVLALLLTGRAGAQDALAVRYLMDRANSKLRSRDIEGALADLTKVIHMDPHFPQAYLLRSDVYQRKRATNNAIEDLTKYLQLRPRDANALLKRARAYQTQLAYDRAIEDYTLIVRPTAEFRGTAGNRRKFRAGAYMYRGRVWESKSDPSRAAADYSETIKLDPSRRGIYYLRGQAYASSGNFEGALADYAQANRRTPRNYNVLTSWAWLLSTCPDEKHRDGAQALELIRQCPRQDTWALDITAAAYAQHGDFEEAIQIMEKVVQVPDSPQLVDKRKIRLRLYQERKTYKDEDYGADS